MPLCSQIAQIRCFQALSLCESTYYCAELKMKQTTAVIGNQKPNQTQKPYNKKPL